MLSAVTSIAGEEDVNRGRNVHVDLNTRVLAVLCWPCAFQPKHREQVCILTDFIAGELALIRQWLLNSSEFTAPNFILCCVASNLLCFVERCRIIGSFSFHK